MLPSSPQTETRLFFASFLGCSGEEMSAAGGDGVTSVDKGEGEEEVRGAAARVWLIVFRVAARETQGCYLYTLCNNCKLPPPHLLFRARSLTEILIHNKLPLHKVARNSEHKI